MCVRHCNDTAHNHVSITQLETWQIFLVQTNIINVNKEKKFDKNDVKN